jgi:hypothetical protein
MFVKFVSLYVNHLVSMCQMFISLEVQNNQKIFHISFFIYNCRHDLFLHSLLRQLPDTYLRKCISMLHYLVSHNYV